MINTVHDEATEIKNSVASDVMSLYIATAINPANTTSTYLP